MRRLVASAWIVLAACGDDGGTTPADAAQGSDAPAAFDPLPGAGEVELVRGGYMFLEGPQWRDATGDLVFTDIPASTIYRYVPGGTPTVHRMPSANANGLALDGGGALIAAEHGSRTITRDAVAIASRFDGDRLNSPNDVIVADDGTIYFTDPPYGLGSTPSELGFMGIFRLAPDGTTLTAEHRGPLAARPNGIGLSPDGKTLYADDTADGNLYAFPISPDGTLGQRSTLAATSGNPDGLAIDTGGNIFVTTAAGVEVFSPSGQRWGAITVPEQPSNCAFGDDDHRTLYITARTGLYRVRLAHAGLPRR